MKRIASSFCTAAVAVMATSCNQPADTRIADIEAIKAVEVQWNLDYAARDADRIAAHYADDAVLMIPGMAPVLGKDAIRESEKQMAADPAMSLKFQSTRVDVARSGDLAYSQGSYTLTVTDPQTRQVIHDHGSFVTVYRKQADEIWKAESDIATSEVPPPAPPAPAKKH